MSALRVVRLETYETFARYRAGLMRLHEMYRPVLGDVHDAASLVGNLASWLPNVWIIADQNARVLGVSSLSDEVLGRHAFLHGVSDPAVRGCTQILEAAMAAIDTAFNDLGVLKVKAEFATGNASAKGFCWRFGFRREAVFVDDIRLSGALCDVSLYGLDRAGYAALKSKQKINQKGK